MSSVSAYTMSPSHIHASGVCARTQLQSGWGRDGLLQEPNARVKPRGRGPPLTPTLGSNSGGLAVTTGTDELTVPSADELRTEHAEPTRPSVPSFRRSLRRSVLIPEKNSTAPGPL